MNTVGEIRKAIEGLPDDAPVYVSYGEVDNEYTFVRFDRIIAAAPKDHPPGVAVVVSLICPEDHDEAEEGRDYGDDRPPYLSPGA